MTNELVNYEEQWAKEAAAAAANEQVSGGAFLSTRGGQLTYQDQPMPGNQVAAIVIDSYRENTFYGTKFDPDNPMPPTCYAFARDAEHMAPHPSMQADLNYFKPEHSKCEGCPRNEWGSAEQGRGKACQNRRRLTLLPAGFYVPRRGSRDFDLELFDDTAHFEKAEVGFLKLSVTSVTDWAKYVNQLAASVCRPPYGVVTRIYLEPDAKTQYKIRFEMLELIPDNLTPAIIRRHETASAMPFQGYQPPQDEGAMTPGRQGGSLRGLRQ